MQQAKKKKPKNGKTSAMINAFRGIWMRYGENRKQAILEATVEWVEGRKTVGRLCAHCGSKMRDTDDNGKTPYQIDHIVSVRSKPWNINTPDWPLFIDRLFNGKCELLCKECHAQKTANERAIMKQKGKAECEKSGKSTASKSSQTKRRSKSSQH